ncbi:phosphonate C-P lyase system protein PhnK [Bradyrhizobium sp. B117]|uniref:phosphonate C-P lyase system protein PhnK n=1 Tax=Bradyrhizobium sp. B117 TaxID=3140246 RepID=UPI003182B9F0
MKPRAREILRVEHLSKRFGRVLACDEVSFSLRQGEVLGIVGESGSGKSTLLRCLAGRIQPDDGRVRIASDDHIVDLWAMDEVSREQFLPPTVSLIHQNPRDGLRLDISAGGNIAEPLMAAGGRHYGSLRATALQWLEKVDIEGQRIDDLPEVFSGGMQQRLQIARGLATHPRLVLMDEPTGGLDVSVQAKLLDLLRGLVRQLGIAVVVVTHDIGVARLLADRLMVMQQGRVIEEGLTDQVLDDPHHPYTQLLVASVLQV